MSRHDSRFLRRHSPLLILIGAIFIIWLAQVLGPENWADSFMVVPAQVAESWRHLRAGVFTTADLAAFGTLLSHAFLHGDIEHVLFNMLYLWIFAALIVEHLGRRWFVLIFVVTAIAGGIAHTLLDPAKTIKMLGASGALMGFEAAYLGIALRHQLPDPRVWPLAHPVPPMQLAAFAVLGIAFDFHDVYIGEVDFIAHGAHIGGFVAGLFLTTVVLPSDAVR